LGETSVPANAEQSLGWEPIATLSSVWEAELAKGLLDSHGITSAIERPYVGPYPVTVGSFAEIRLVVPSRDAAAARKLLSESRLPESPDRDDVN
jgi:hypothetical protein